MHRIKSWLFILVKLFFISVGKCDKSDAMPVVIFETPICLAGQSATSCNKGQPLVLRIRCRCYWNIWQTANICSYFFCQYTHRRIVMLFVSWPLNNPWIMTVMFHRLSIAVCVHNPTVLQGAVSIRKTVLPGMAIPMLKIRRPNGRLIFNMGIAIRR